MKIWYSVMALMLVSSSGFVCAQNQNARMQTTRGSSIFASYPNLEAQAKDFGEAFIRKDFERLVDLTYPKYIEISGGKQHRIRVVSRTAREFEARGEQVESWTPTEAVQLLKKSGSLYAVLQITITTRIYEDVFQVYDCLIGVSIDHGENWTFVSSGCLALKEMFPDVAEQLIVCPDKQLALVRVTCP